MTPQPLAESSSSLLNIEDNDNFRQDEEESLFENKECNDFYEILKTEAPYLPGDCRLQTLPKDIPWIEPKLLEEGRKFVKENYFFLSFVHTLTLLVTLGVSSICVVMLRTGKFHKPDKSAFKKIFTTAARIMQWYEEDILEENSKVFNSIQFVRRMHLGASRWRERGRPSPVIDDSEINEKNKAVIKAIKDDLQFIDTSNAPNHLLTWVPEVEFSQWDNILIQWATFAWPEMIGKLLGIGDEKDFEGFRHTWAVFGRLLGIEDRFNLALHYSPEISRKLLTDVFVASLKNVDFTNLVAKTYLVKGVSVLIPFARLKPLVYCTLNYLILEYEGKNLYENMAWYDKIIVFLYEFGLWLVIRFSFIRRLVNWWGSYFIYYNIKKHVPKLS